MRHHTLTHALSTVVVCGAMAAALAARGAQDHQHPAAGGVHHHPEAAKLKNPVAADATSIAARTYDWNHDPARLYAARHQMAEAIDRATR